MSALLLAQFAVLAALLGLTPGADWAFAISTGVRGRAIAPAIAGMATAYAVVVVAVALGLGALITHVPAALAALSSIGACYLLYLGLRMLTSGSQAHPLGDARVADRATAQFVRGLGVSGLNPKGLLLLVALLPQFTSPHGWAPQVQMLTLGAVHVGYTIVIQTGVALLARRLLRDRPRATRLVSGISAVAMLLIAAGILVEQFVHALG